MFQVYYGWLKDPSTDGEVAVTGLSVGEHYFACSVGDHCQRGMRFTITVESREGSGSHSDRVEDEVSNLVVIIIITNFMWIDLDIRAYCPLVGSRIH